MLLKHAKEIKLEKQKTFNANNNDALQKQTDLTLELENKLDFLMSMK